MVCFLGKGEVEMIKRYIDFDKLSLKQCENLFSYIFDYADSFTFRFPNVKHSTSNTLSIKYDDTAQINNEFLDYIAKNNDLIGQCEKNLIKKSISNIYFNDKYNNKSVIYHCRIFDELKKMIKLNPNLFEWIEPELPEDISFHKKGKLFLYTCSHERLSIIFCNDNKQADIISKIVD